MLPPPPDSPTGLLRPRVKISVAEGAERWANETGLRVDRVIQYERGIADVTFIINDLKVRMLHVGW